MSGAARSGDVAVRCFPTLEALSRAAAAEFARLAAAGVGAHGYFTVALTGGSTPRRLYELLAQPPLRREVPWDRIEFFWGDERAVPPGHPQSNYRMAREVLLHAVGVEPARVHRMPAERADLDTAAREYQAEMARACGADADGPPPRLDLVLLGMGADGHVASLFPGTAALAEDVRWVVGNDVPQLAVRRMTVTLPLLNRAAHVAFLVAGAAKAEALGTVLGEDRAGSLPAGRVRPSDGGVVWFIDRAAARLTRFGAEA